MSESKKGYCIRARQGSSPGRGAMVVACFDTEAEAEAEAKRRRDAVKAKGEDWYYFVVFNLWRV